MKSAVTIIGGDKRFLFLRDFLLKKGIFVNTVFLGEENRETVNNTVILPVPVFRNGLLNAPLTDKKTSEENLVELLPENSTVFGGMVTQSLSEKCRKKGMEIIDYYKEETLLNENAVLTANAVPFILEENDISPKDGKIFILGYGRCGRALADVLSSLGGNVTVVTGKQKIDNYGYIHFNELNDYLCAASLIVNTVPSAVLTENELIKLNRNAVIIEIASAPYGIDFDSAKRLGIKVIIAPSLPGRYFPEKAGQAIAKTILKEMR